MRELFPAMLTLSIALFSPRSAGEDIMVGGSGGATLSLEPVVEAFHKAHPGVRVRLQANLGSRGGIRAAAEGAIHVAVASRPLSEEERARGLAEIEFARTPFVFAVSRKSQAARSVTLAQLVEIYSGKTLTWPDGTRLRLVLRPPGDSDTLMLRSLSAQMREASVASENMPGMVMGITDLDSTENIENIPGAIGTTTLAQITLEKRALRPLAFEGVEPTVSKAMSGAYPLHKRLYLVARPTLAPGAQKFVDFVRSPAARGILERYGHWVAAQPGGAASAQRVPR